MPSIAVQKQG